MLKYKRCLMKKSLETIREGKKGAADGSMQDFNYQQYYFPGS